MINRAYEYEDSIKKSVQQSISKITKGDVGGQISYSQSVAFENDKLHSIEDVSHSSLFSRVFHEGRVGNSSVSSPFHIDLMIDNAKESARFGEKIEINLPQKNDCKNVEWLYTEDKIKYNKLELKEMAQELLYEIKKFAPKAKVSTSAQNFCSQFFLQNTNGFVGEYQCSSLSVSGGVFELSEDGSFLEMYEGESFYDNEYSFTLILKELEKQLERSRQRSVLTKTGEMPVIIAPSAMDMILSPIEIAINGKVLYKDLSLFAHRLEEQIFDEKFTFTDDPLYYHGASSAPFDDEGTINRSLPIFQKGVFKNFIYDCTTAKKMKAQTTGHASRGVTSLPTPSLSNRILGTGKQSIQEMISSIDYGLILLTSLGEGQSNVIAGDFSVLAETAYLIENGQLKGKVKDIMLSGNVFELLKNIPMVENKLYKEGSLFTPHILLDKVVVSKQLE